MLQKIKENGRWITDKLLAKKAVQIKVKSKLSISYHGWHLLSCYEFEICCSLDFTFFRYIKKWSYRTCVYRFKNFHKSSSIRISLQCLSYTQTCSILGLYRRSTWVFFTDKYQQEGESFIFYFIDSS